MRTIRSYITCLVTLVGIALVGILCWQQRVTLQDVARNILTENNSVKGVIPTDSIKWCILPISHDLDQGGVPDDIQDITHPSVIYVPEGMFTHTWWMSATPYPQSLKVHGEPYENTCIFYSDKVTLSLCD